MPFIFLILRIPAIIVATTIHEFTRALVSNYLGDNTPKNEKRLTLNPINHFEPVGFLLMYSTSIIYGAGCGWGKPVNTNPRHYANRRAGVVLCAVLPSVANLLTAVVFSYLFKYAGSNQYLSMFFQMTVLYNIYLAAFNLLPVAPFDCLKIVMEFVSRKNYFSMTQSESIMQLVLLFLMFAGLLSYVMNPICNIILAAVQSLTF